MEALELEPILPSNQVTEKNVGAFETTEQTDAEESVSYWTLLRTNRPFTLYLCSYITNHVGEWLTYLASLTALSEMQQGGDSSSTAIGLLVAVRLLTNVAAAPWGGALADAMDRRLAMIVLDVAGAVIAWVFLGAVRWKSPILIYVATFLQEVDAGLYEPSRSAIVPLLCPTDAALETATLLTGIAWSTVAATASAAGGLLVSVLGLQGCFVCDSATYLVSAWFLTCVGGNWNAKDLSKKTSDSGSREEAASSGAMDMVRDGWRYLRSTPWGPLVGLKFSVTWLTMDVLMVDFAARAGESSSLHLGALFGAVGLGCLIGPPLVSKFTNLKERPGTVQVAAVVALGWSTMACFLLSLGILGNPLWVLCLCTVMRSSGVAILWIQSSLLLQKLSRPDYLGRVSSFDFGLALVGEALSALITGQLRDRGKFTPEQVCGWLAALGVFFTAYWTVFTLRGGGAMQNNGKGVRIVDTDISPTQSEVDDDEEVNQEMLPMTATMTDSS